MCILDSLRQKYKIKVDVLIKSLKKNKMYMPTKHCIIH